jgi:hypothetical protein
MQLRRCLRPDASDSCSDADIEVWLSRDLRRRYQILLGFVWNLDERCGGTIRLTKITLDTKYITSSIFRSKIPYRTNSRVPGYDATVGDQSLKSPAWRRKNISLPSTQSPYVSPIMQISLMIPTGEPNTTVRTTCRDWPLGLAG